MTDAEIRERIALKGLKVTPQRVAVMSALMQLNNHPTTEGIVDKVRERNPNISVGTIYNILDTLVDKGIVRRVKTEKDNMRYDSVDIHHHHLYDSGSDRIVDFMDEELDKLISAYFDEKGIPGFEIADIRIHMTGKFTRKQADGSDN